MVKVAALCLLSLLPVTSLAQYGPQKGVPKDTYCWMEWEKTIHPLANGRRSMTMVCQKRSVLAIEHVDRAYELFDEKKYRLALEQCEIALQLDRGNKLATALRRKVRAVMGLGR